MVTRWGLALKHLLRASGQQGSHKSASMIREWESVFRWPNSCLYSEDGLDHVVVLLWL